MAEIKDNRVSREIFHHQGNRAYKEQECPSCKLKKVKLAIIIEKVMLLINKDITNKDLVAQIRSLNQMEFLQCKCAKVEVKEAFEASSLSYNKCKHHPPKEQ